MLAVKKIIVRLICMPLVAELIYRCYRGRIPFRGFLIDTTNSHVPRSVVPRLFWKLYEKAEVDFVAAHLRSELPVIELGSCLGVVACCIAEKQATDSRLISVEANPELRSVIMENVQRNVPGKEIEVVTGAIDYSENATVRFAISHDAVGSHVTHSDQHSEECYEVAALQLGQLLSDQRVDGPYALVCDIEAAEAGIILSDATALQNCQQIIIELHPGSYAPWNTDIESLKKELTETHGFSLTTNRGHVYLYERGLAEPVS